MRRTRVIAVAAAAVFVVAGSAYAFEGEWRRLLRIANLALEPFGIDVAGREGRRGEPDMLRATVSPNAETRYEAVAERPDPARPGVSIPAYQANLFAGAADFTAFEEVSLEPCVKATSVEGGESTFTVYLDPEVPPDPGIPPDPGVFLTTADGRTQVEFLSVLDKEFIPCIVDGDDVFRVVIFNRAGVVVNAYELTPEGALEQR